MKSNKKEIIKTKTKLYQKMCLLLFTFLNFFFVVCGKSERGTIKRVKISCYSSKSQNGEKVGSYFCNNLGCHFQI